ncbi:cupin domain-containing protein (plasmid) [Sphingobium sp. SJ10-10]|uniref:cupin domain-containing protein n=1 Tax=Sphingobium sp. SJ10-10 TaxID=3114999 RepID=UPI002E180671|nr:cupin domain-containing protein [Sphingobium sp. SJ10-10]
MQQLKQHQRTVARPPRAFADPDLVELGRSIELGLLGGDRFADLEREGRARLFHGATLAKAPSAASLWSLVSAGELSFDEDEIRLVVSGPGGLRVIPPEVWTIPGDRASRPIRTTDPARVHRLFDQGTTIVFQQLDRRLPALARVAAALSARFGHPVQCSAYLSPPSAQGLDIHHDTHDVLVLQIEGLKRFRLFEPIVAQPVPRIDLSPAQVARARPVRDVALMPGDLLYLPRGVPHCAVAGEDFSLHLTIGVLAQSWAALIEPLASELYFLEPLRQAIPTGGIYDPETLRRGAEAAVDQIVAWLRVFGTERLAALASERFVASFARRPPYPDEPDVPVGSLEPAPDDGEVLITPTARKRYIPPMGDE